MSGFDASFRVLTGYDPFPWQRRLYERFVGATDDEERFPPCSLPTGLGKTSVMAVWLLALAATADNEQLRGRVPRRLAYVVNRRTIVDQATREAEKLRENLQNDKLREVHAQLRRLAGESAGDLPLAISTLRGQFADNGEWAADPTRPAIIVGTVDMIGSRLLFSGYGRGFKSRPLHAGFLGQDTLLVHDEAHLEPAFQTLLDTIRTEQTKGRCRDPRPLRIMPLTATPRASGGAAPFELDNEDHEHRIIKQRLEAKKTIELHSLEDEKKTAEAVAVLALRRAEASPESAILVFVRKVDDVKKVVDALGKAKGVNKDKQIEQLTGTLRGLERDALVKTPVFQRCLSPANRDPAVTPESGAAFLVCTSAGEVGVDMSADHLVCDLTTFDSMAQRFGRVNRYGERHAMIDVVHPDDDGFKSDEAYDARRRLTLELLKRLDGDGSPRAIAALPLDERAAAFSPTPKILDTTDILLDAWALTTIREKMPGRPPVADWLHGVAEWQPPETQVAWREEAQWITGELLKGYKPDDLLEVYPLKPHELLRDRTDRVFEELQAIAAREPQSSVWITNGFGVRVALLNDVAPASPSTEDKKRLIADIADAIVLLPPFVGGLKGGMLNGLSLSADDVADQWFDENRAQRRKRVWADTDRIAGSPGMRPVRAAIDMGVDAEEELEEERAGVEEDGEAPCGPPRPPGRVWMWFTRPRSADDDGSRVASMPVPLETHLNDVQAHVARIVGALGLTDAHEGRALMFAAAAHDLGKDRGVWQRSIRNDAYPEKVLAKSGHGRPPRDLSRYRHEFGSLLDVLSPAENSGRPTQRWATLDEFEQDLALHFIAAHHGRGRPHFPTEEAFDPERSSAAAARIATEVPRRFARLQRRYGRWGLAYLESILRAADAAASAEPSETMVDAGAEAVAAAGDAR